MNKCPHCGAVLKPLTRICEACGSEIPSTASVTAQSASGSSPLPTASEVCANIQKDLAQLATRPPMSRPAAFLLGLITLPTLGLAYLAFKLTKVFGSDGKPPQRELLDLEQNIRLAENFFKADPGVRTLADKGKDEMTDYVRRQHSSRNALLAGIVASIVLALAATGGEMLFQNYQAEKVAQAVLAAKNAADARQAALNLQQEQEQAKQRADAATVAQEIHGQATNLANRLGADVSYKAAVLVENRAGSEMADKVSVLEDLLNSRLAGHGYAIMSRADVVRAETALSNIGPQAEAIDVVGQHLVTIAQNIGADFIVYASITSFGNEKKSFTGNGVTTDNYIYSLRVAFRLIEAGEGGAITGGTVVASKTVRQSGALQTDSTELINQLLDDAAAQVVTAVTRTKPNPPAGGN